MNCGEELTDKQKPKKYLIIGGLVLLLLGITAAILLFSLQFEGLWRWYNQLRDHLIDIENRITALDNRWQFFIAVLFLFLVESLLPIYPISSVCFLSGMVLPMYYSIPVNVIGFSVTVSSMYFFGKKTGAGNAWMLIRKNRKLRRLIQQDGKGNPALLIILRMVPFVPINSISRIYGSFEFGYWQYLLLSIIGFMPKLISFTFVGRNFFDPFSAGFLLPVMVICLGTGASLLSVDGVWITAERIINKERKKLQKRSNDK